MFAITKDWTQERSHSAAKILHIKSKTSPLGLLDRMIQILTEVVLKPVSSGSLEDVQEMGSVYYKNFSVSGTLFLKYLLLA